MLATEKYATSSFLQFFQPFLTCLHSSLRISLSKAHTKLSLRKKVLEEDALIAILLFESSLTLKYGEAVFSVGCIIFMFCQFEKTYLKSIAVTEVFHFK